MRPRLAVFGLAALVLASCGRAGPDGQGSATAVTPRDPSSSAPPVAQDGTPEDAARGRAANVLIGAWVLVTYQAESGFEEAVAANERYTIEFTADGRVAGQADCNRYTGAYSEPAPGRLAMGANMAVTMAACPPASRSPEYLRAVGAATRYELVGGELKLFGGGDALTFARAPANEIPEAGPDAPAEPQASVPEVGRTVVYDCGADVSFTVRTGPGEVALWAPASLGSAYAVLASTPAASGARYADGDTVYWNRGELASFEIGGRRYVDCRANPAKVPWADAARRGVVFRGLGQEPAWNVEIERERKIVLVTDYGATRTEVAHAEPRVEDARTTYRSAAAATALTVVVERRACADSMSGEAFEAAVTVTLADRLLYGCGRFL
jgi:putative lipoprotein